MRLRTGAILSATRPETIITSACRGLARKTSEPKRARSLRDEVAFIISMAQHASPNVAGQSEDLRAQFTSESSRVVKTSGRASAKTFSKPIKPPQRLRRLTQLASRDASRGSSLSTLHAARAAAALAALVALRRASV